MLADIAPPVTEPSWMSFAHQPDIAIVSLRGELDVFGAPALRAGLLEELESGRSCVVDLRAVEFIDSAILGALLAAKHRATQDGLALVLVIDPEQAAITRAVDGSRLRFEQACTLTSALLRAQQLAGAGVAPPLAETA
jgi:anti-sigma B factor antagonist